MKKYQKGFALPALVAIIALLIIGGVYYYLGSDTRSSVVSPAHNNSNKVIPNNSSDSNPVIPTAPISPTITILSPNAGESLKFNTKNTISWNYTGLNDSDIVSIIIRTIDHDPCVIGKTTVLARKYDFIPSEVSCTGTSLTKLNASTHYKAQIIVEKYAEGRGVADMSDDYFTFFIQPNQQTSQAKSVIENIRNDFGPNYKIESWMGFKNIPGYKLSLNASQKSYVHGILVAKIQEATHPYNFGDRVEHAYENWHLLCMIVGLGSGSSPSDLPYVWCGDKVGIQTIDVLGKDVRDIDSNTRTFTLTLGGEVIKIRMPTIIQNTDYKNGTFADFVNAVSQYQNTTIRMSGELKGEVFEVSSIQWILG